MIGGGNSGSAKLLYKLDEKFMSRERERKKRKQSREEKRCQ